MFTKEYIRNKNQELLKEYSINKEKGYELLDKGSIEKAIFFLKYACYIAWKYPIVFEYCDTELEGRLDKISEELFANDMNDDKSVSDNNKVVLYSSEIVDFGALTEQYLHYLVDNKYEVLLVIPDKSKIKLGKNILQYVEDHKVSLHISDSAYPALENIKKLKKVIDDFSPSKSFLHFHPTDIEGYILFKAISHKKYFIVHSDHTFWIGMGCSDFIIEFRDFGVSLSTFRRKIDKSKILKINFYPIIKEGVEFKGFPVDLENKVIGVSGANLYKYYFDNELKFFKVIKELLEEHDDFIFFLCGGGDSTKVMNFIAENKLEDRFFYLGKRGDFSEVVKHGDILFESYPFKGGLVPLYAMREKIPVIGMANYAIPSGSLESFFSIKNYVQPINFIEFKEEAKKLITDKNYRKELGEIVAKNHFNKADFYDSVDKIFKNLEAELNPIEVYELKLSDLENLLNYVGLNNVKEVLEFQRLNTVGHTFGFVKKLIVYLKFTLIQKTYPPRPLVGLFLNIFLRNKTKK